jgi:hypothetical protein
MRSNPRSFVLSFLVALSCLHSPIAVAADESLPDEIGKRLSEMSEECADMGEHRAKGGRETVKSADLNGDGVADYVFYEGDYKCEGAASEFAPTAAAGVPATLFLGSKDGNAVEAWSSNVWGTRIKRVDGVETLIVDVAGLDCTDKPAKDIASMARCQRQVRYDRQSGKWQMIPLPAAAAGK